MKDEIKNGEFGEFRLQVFYSLAMACGCVKPGNHLEFLFYPVKGSRSHTHMEEKNSNKSATFDEILAMNDVLDGWETSDFVSQRNLNDKNEDNDDSTSKSPRVDLKEALKETLDPKGSIDIELFDLCIDILGDELSMPVDSRRLMEGVSCESRPHRCLRLKSLFRISRINKPAFATVSTIRC